jgi:hypothetical protein
MTVAQAFDSLIFPQGLHLSRCRIPTAPGIFTASSSATFRQGQCVSLDSSGEIVLCTGLDFFGIAKWTKDTGYGNAVAVDEPVVLNGTTVTSLARGAIVGSSATNNSIKVSLTAGGAALTVGAGNDYVVDSLTNGTLHRDASGTIPDGATVYVSYTYALTAQDMQFQGENFWNRQDDVTINGGRVAVVLNSATLFTTEYVTGVQWQVNDLVYAGQTDSEDQGLVTNDSGEGDQIGRVIQVPTATDPYLGWELIPGGAAGS